MICKSSPSQCNVWSRLTRWLRAQCVSQSDSQSRSLRAMLAKPALSITCWLREAHVVGRDEGREKVISLRNGLEVREAHLLDEAVLEGAPEPFNSAFALSGEGPAWAVDAQLTRLPPSDLALWRLARELLLKCGLLRGAQDGVAVVVDGRWRVPGSWAMRRHEKVICLVLCGAETCVDDLACSVVHRT